MIITFQSRFKHKRCSVFFVSTGNPFDVYFTTPQLVFVPCGRRISPKCRLYLIYFAIIGPIVVSLKMEFMLEGISSLQTQLLFMKRFSKTEIPIFLSVVCSLFPKAIYFKFIENDTKCVVRFACRLLMLEQQKITSRIMTYSTIDEYRQGCLEKV